MKKLQTRVRNGEDAARGLYLSARSVAHLPMCFSFYAPFTMSSKLHRNPPLRVEHQGPLLQVRHTHDQAGRDPGSEVRAIEVKDIIDIVKTQLYLRFHAITDGEYRRRSMQKHPVD